MQYILLTYQTKYIIHAYTHAFRTYVRIHAHTRTDMHLNNPTPPDCGMPKESLQHGAPKNPRPQSNNGSTTNSANTYMNPEAATGARNVQQVIQRQRSLLMQSSNGNMHPEKPARVCLPVCLALPHLLGVGLAVLHPDLVGPVVGPSDGGLHHVLGETGGRVHRHPRNAPL